MYSEFSLLHPAIFAFIFHSLSSALLSKLNAFLKYDLPNVLWRGLYVDKVASRADSNRIVLASVIDIHLML